MAFRVDQRFVDDAARDAAAFEVGGDFRMVDAHHAVDDVVSRDAQPAIDLGFEAIRRGVVPDGEVGRAGAVIADVGVVGERSGSDRTHLQGSWIFPPPKGPPGGSAPPCGITSDDDACRRISAISCIAWATPSLAAFA